MKKILATALFGLTVVAPITAIPAAAQSVATDQTITFAVDNMTCAHA
jgi:mercuric ion binding protein